MADVKRKQRALLTRRSILRAATVEFERQGYAGTTMAAIAERAGVAVQTVYFAFRTKPLLLTASIDAAVMGDSDPVAPELAPWFTEATTTSDGPRALELFVANVAAIENRAARLNQVAAEAAGADEDVASVCSRHQALRAASFLHFADTLAGRGLLATDVDEGADVLLTLCGSAVFLEFTVERGWSVQRYVTWATDALGRLLLR